MADDSQLATARRLLDEGAPTSLCVRRISSRWGTAILAALLIEPHRFAALRDRIDGISEKMLAQNLKMMTGSGLVHRSVEETVPPQVTYSLTELGRSLTTPLIGLVGWFEQHGDELVLPRSH